MIKAESREPRCDPIRESELIGHIKQVNMRYNIIIVCDFCSWHGSHNYAIPSRKDFTCGVECTHGCEVHAPLQAAAIHLRPRSTYFSSCYHGVRKNLSARGGGE